MLEPTIKLIARQRGITLIEAMISMLIIAITTAGSLYVVSRANVAKTQMGMENIAVQQMRAILMEHKSGGSDICTTAPVLNLPGVAVQPTLAVAGCAVVAGAEVKVGSEVVHIIPGTPSPMPGRIVLTASHNDTSVLASDITVGGT